jgi:hypothetical protein
LQRGIVIIQIRLRMFVQVPQSCIPVLADEVLAEFLDVFQIG